MVDCDEYEVRKPGVRVDYFIHSELKISLTIVYQKLNMLMYLMSG